MFTPGFWRIKRFADTVPEMLHLQREMNNLLDDFFRGFEIIPRKILLG